MGLTKVNFTSISPSTFVTGSGATNVTISGTMSFVDIGGVSGSSGYVEGRIYLNNGIFNAVLSRTDNAWFINPSFSYTLPCASYLSNCPKNILNAGLFLGYEIRTYGASWIPSVGFSTRVPYTPQVDNCLTFTSERVKILPLSVGTFTTIAARDTWTSYPANKALLSGGSDKYCKVGNADPYVWYKWNRTTTTWDTFDIGTWPDTYEYRLTVTNADIYNTSSLGTVTNTEVIASWGDNSATSSSLAHNYTTNGTYSVSVVIRKTVGSIVFEVRGSTTITVNLDDPDPDPPEPVPPTPDPEPDPPILEVYTRVTKVGKTITLQLDNNKNLEFTNVTWTINTG